MDSCYKATATRSRRFADAFHALGLRVYDHWLLCLAIPLLLSAVCGCGYLWLPARMNGRHMERGYIPENGRAAQEKRVMDELWPLDESNFKPQISYDAEWWADVVFVVKDKRRSLTEAVLARKVVAARDHIENKIVVNSTDNNEMTYSDLCLTFRDECILNKQTDLIQSFTMARLISHVSYPRAYYKGYWHYLANTFAGVTMDAHGEVESIKAVKMGFFLKERPESDNWILALEHYIVQYEDEDIQAAIFHTNSLTSGLREMEQEVVPKFAFAFILIVIFVTLNTFKFYRIAKGPLARYIWIDWIRSQPMCALGGTLSNCLAIVTAIGFLLLTDLIAYKNIVAVTPFLALAIGADDTFIMLSYWHLSAKQARHPRDRLAITLAESATSVTITSLTDCVSFAIGSASPLPAFRSFCGYTAIVIAVLYVYQLTFFASLLALQGRRQADGRHCITYCKTETPSDGTSACKRVFCTGTLEHDKQSITKRVHAADGFMRRWFAPYLFSPVGLVLTIFVFVVYMVFACAGIYVMKRGLEPTTLMLPSHHARVQYQIQREYFWKQGPQAHIMIANPPDFANASQRLAFLDAMTDFEDTSHTMSGNATCLWLRDYMEHLEKKNISDSGTAVWTADLQKWLYDSPYALDVVWSNNDTAIRATRFRIGLKNFGSTEQHKEAANIIRRVADHRSEYNISTFHMAWPFADLYLIIYPYTVQTILVAVAAISVIALLMLPSLTGAALVTLAVICIDIGVCGFLSWWDVSLDGVSMTTLIMSIGLAVDLSAHVTHAYALAPGSAEERGIRALTEVGAPIFQAASSTVLGVSALALTTAYSAHVFLKTVFLVVSFGLMFGLMILPIFLVYATKANDAIVKLCKRANMGLHANGSHGAPGSNGLVDVGTVKLNGVVQSDGEEVVPMPTRETEVSFLPNIDEDQDQPCM